MKPIRILHVFASLDRGGAETMIMTIYRKIDKEKIQFDFIVNDQKEEYAYESEIKSLGGKIYRMPEFKLYNYFSYKKKWSKLLSEHSEWKIIHGHHTTPACIYLSVANALDRVTIAHSHIAGGDKSLKNLVKKLLRRPLSNTADYLFACSELAAKWMFGKNNERVTIINNSIETEKFIFNIENRVSLRKKLNLNDKFVIGHVGRFHEQKNHAFLLDIFYKVLKKKDNAILLLVGDGELRTLIEDKVRKLGIEDKVIFTGVRSDIPDLLQVMDVFVFPSLYEGLGIVLIEAQTAGLKCFTSDKVVPNEAKVTNLLEYISLKKSPGYWAEAIINANDGYKRISMDKVVKDTGYDVEENVKWLQNFYLSLTES
jgi:glycosyltransferase involved in cell wall biosynthesis